MVRYGAVIGRVVTAAMLVIVVAIAVYQEVCETCHHRFII